MAYLDDNGYDIPPYLDPSRTSEGPGGITGRGVDPRPVMITDPAIDPAIEAQVQALAAQHGIAYDPSDTLDVMRNGGDVGIAAAKYAQRAASNGGGGGQVQPLTFGRGASVGGAPQPIQPYGEFRFDPSQVGKSEGFKFRFDKAINALEKSGLSKGNYFTPQVREAIQAEASGLAAQEFDNEYSRQANTYGLNFGTHGWNEGQRYSSQRQNRLDDFGIMDSDRRFARGNFESDRAFGRGVYQDDRDFDYRKTRDTRDDEWRYIDLGFQAQR